jgi:hypothetical protein
MYQLPNTDELANFYTSLLGERVTVEEGEPLKWNSQEVFTGAVYQKQDKVLGAGALCDIGFAAYVSAALTVTPRAVADNNVKTGVLDGHLHEAFSEVMNITAGLMNDVDATHVALKKTFPSRRQTSDEAKRFFAMPPEESTKHYIIDIPSLGEGRLTLFRK